MLAVKGAMVAFQGQVRFDHEKAGGVGKLLKKMVTSEDMPLMRVSGQGEVFFAHEAGYVYLVELGGDGISVNGRNLLAFDARSSGTSTGSRAPASWPAACSTRTVSGTGDRRACARSGTPSSWTARSSRRTSTCRRASLVGEPGAATWCRA